MGKLNAPVDKLPRRTLTVFFLIDTSGSMAGGKISSLNVAIRDTIPMLSQLSSENTDTEIKIAALQFASGCDWMYPRPLPVEDFEWNDLEANGLTSLGAAYQELLKKLSQTSGFMQEANASCAPVMILFSDGVPTDDAKHGLEHLKENNWYKAAIKIAVAIGDDANKDILKEFVNNHSEAVLTVHNVNDLKKMIYLVSVTASQVASKGVSVGTEAPESRQKEVMQDIKQAIKKDSSLKKVDVGADANDNKGSDDWTNW
jgi:uncharacterized protein YegL